MGYPVEMIGKETTLFSLIGESAIESKKEALFNAYFKERDVDAKMMPLNIRMDDIGFFIYGFKDSQIKGAYFLQEYWEKLYDLLDEMSEEAKLCGIVDTIDVIDKQNIASLTQGRAMVSLLEPTQKRIGIYGNTPSVKSFLYHLKNTNVKEIILYDEVVENCAQLATLLPATTKVDIVRVQENSIMIDSCDVFIDALANGVCHYHDIPTILTLNYHDSDNLNFHDIENEIAKIKTKEWMNNG